ncbi:MAG TPA: hypothetical protein VH331_18470 [Allosphingosinicella sp.]|jgi:hypothetical protein|nr:hypothetical protein [Allosphingosinicella sp.]
MKTLLASALALAALAPAVAFAGPFRVGERVLIGNTHDTGTVIEIGQQLADGGTMIKVHLDRLGLGFPTVGSWYDTKVSQVTVTGTAGSHVGAPAGAPASPARQPVMTAPMLPPPPTLASPPAGAAPSAAFCQQLIRANYPPGGADQRITVNFLAFQMGGAQAHEAVYANDPNGRGHQVRAWPIHARYTVLTHYADPNADDQLRTYDANYLCYKLPVGGWVVEMTSRAPGGETAQYIHKTR